MSTMQSQESPVNRRQFIVSTLATAAAFTIVKPSLVRGAEANSKIRLGIIGCGGRGAWIANLFNKHGGYEIVGAADYFEERAKGVADKFQLQPDRVFTGLRCYEKMIEKGGLDAVALISPPYFRPEQARAAVDAGLHVYAAKPLAVDVPGCRSIRASGEAATKKGKVFVVDFQTRANEFYIEALKRVHAGALGVIAYGAASYEGGRLGLHAKPGTPEARLKNWVFDIALSGDVIVEQFIHALDVMNWSMNHVPPLRCTGTGGRKVRTDVGDCWDYFTLTYEYPDNVGIAFTSRQFNCDAPGGIIHNLYGSKGALLTQYGGNVMIRGGEDTFYRGGNTGPIYQQGAETNIKTFHEAVTKGDASNPTVEPSVLSNLISIMGRTAAYTGRTVTWSELMRSVHRLDGKLEGLKA